MHENEQLIAWLKAHSGQSWRSDQCALHPPIREMTSKQSLDALSRELVDRAASNGCSVVTLLDGEQLPDYTHPSGQQLTKPVHFGYSDGISQPDVLPAPNRKPGAPPAVPPGMFVLGHPDSPQDGSSYAVANQATRLVKLDDPTDEQLTTLTADDIPTP